MSWCLTACTLVMLTAAVLCSVCCLVEGLLSGVLVHPALPHLLFWFHYLYPTGSYCPYCCEATLPIHSGACYLSTRALLQVYATAADCAGVQCPGNVCHIQEQLMTGVTSHQMLSSCISVPSFRICTSSDQQLLTVLDVYGMTGIPGQQPAAACVY